MVQIEDSSDLHESARKVLVALRTAGGEVKTGVLKEYSGLTGQNVVYHCNSTLVPSGLVERAGTEDEPDTARRPAVIWALTDQGSEMADDVRSGTDLSSIEARVESLEATNKELIGRIEELEDQQRTIIKGVLEWDQ